MTRFLYVVALVLALAVGYHAWILHGAWNVLDRDTATQSWGPPADKARIRVDAFFNYAHRPTRDISAAIMDVIAKNPDTRIIIHVVPTGSMLALRSAQVALAAGLQGKFIAMNEDLMRNTDPLTDNRIRAMATRLKLDPDRLLTDMVSPPVAAALTRVTAAERTLGVLSSPLFIIDRTHLYGPDSESAAPGDLNNLLQQERMK